jgi:hypothetical protein
VEGARLQQQSHQLVGAQFQDAEHQMTHHLGVAPDHDVSATELVLEAGIAALGDGALVVADGIRRFEFGLLGVCSGYVRFFITSAQQRAVADTFDDVPDHTAPGLGTDTPMNIAHA